MLQTPPVRTALHRRYRRWLAPALALALIGCAGDQTATSLSHTRSAVSANAAVVISQVYGGGGNASAPFQNDFIELFNRTSSPVPVDGWSVQYASATGTGLFSANVTLLSGTIAPGHYYLVREAGGPTGVALPASDASGAINMSATAGKVVLVSSQNGLACNGGPTACSASDSALIVDLVGFGSTSTFFEGAGPTGTLSNTTAALRAAAGCADSNNNAADFAVGAPTPRNSASAANTCSLGDAAPAVVGTVPSDGASNVDPGSIVSVTFSEPVAVTATAFTLDCAGAIALAVSGGPTTFSLTPASALPAGATCHVTVAAAGVSDLDTADPPDTLAADFTFAFTISGTAPTPIHTVQGAAHLSPLAGQVLNVGPAVVTALASNGFYMQDPSPDGNDATSEGIFVFLNAAPAVAVGDELVVRGTVSEFRAGCTPCTSSDDAFNNLTQTELDAPSISVRGHGRALPPPVVLGSGPGERRPPTTIIEDDATGNIETSGMLDPATDGIDFFESLEGMRVRIDNPVVVDPSRLFSGGSSIEIGVLTRGGADAGPRTPRGGNLLQQNDPNPERIFLANTLISSFPILNVGDGFAGSVVGVVGYSFDDFKILVSDPLPPVTRGGIAQEITPLTHQTATHLTVASINVENLAATDPATKFSRLAAIVVQNLGAPDLLAVEEIQDNDGATDDGVVDATVTLNTLVSAITAAGGPTYTYREIDPQNDLDGGQPGGNIRVVYMFRSDRGLAFVDRPGATSTTANDITGAAGAPHLLFSPGRLDPTNTAFTSSRKPLAAEVTFGGQTLFIIANHFNSKLGDQPLYGRFQPPALGSQAQRIAQANVVGGFVSRLFASDPAAKVIVLGDLNDFSWSPPVLALKATGLTDMIETLPANERYTYVFQGNSQVLDHIMATTALATRGTFDVVHVNAEFSDQASDHEPAVTRFDFGGAPVITSVPATSVLAGATFTYDIDANGSPAPTYALVSGPTGTTVDAATGVLRWIANVAPGNVVITVRATNGAAPDATQSLTLQVAAPPPAVPATSGVAIAVLGAAMLVWGARRASKGGVGRSR
jgi:predicted extracellular nuclease